MRAVAVWVVFLALSAGVVAAAVLQLSPPAVVAITIAAGLMSNVAASYLFERLHRGRTAHSATGTVLDQLFAGEQRALDIRDELIQRALKPTHAKVARATGVRGERIGIHCWLIHPPDGSEDKQRLQRVARYRPGTSPPNVGKVWRKGHGLVGWCWETKHWEYEDLRRFDGQVLDSGRYAGLQDVDRKDRTFAEFDASRRDHGVMLAAPMIDRERVRGVVSLNYNHDVDDPPESLVSAAVRTAVEQAASDCATFLRKAGVFDR